MADSKKEKIIEIHTQVYDALIDSLKLALKGKQDEAQVKYKKAGAWMNKIGEILEADEAHLFRAKIDELTQKQYPYCTVDQMKKNKAQHDKKIECLEISKKLGALTAESLFGSQSANVKYTHLLPKEVKNVVELKGDVGMLKDLVVIAKEKIILNYNEIFCFSANITAPDIYLPQQSKVYLVGECNFNGNVHYHDHSDL